MKQWYVRIMAVLSIVWGGFFIISATGNSRFPTPFRGSHPTLPKDKKYKKGD